MINSNSSVEKCVADLEKGNQVLALMTAYWAIGEEIKYTWYNFVKKILEE